MIYVFMLYDFGHIRLAVIDRRMLLFYIVYGNIFVCWAVVSNF